MSRTNSDKTPLGIKATNTLEANKLVLAIRVYNCPDMVTEIRRKVGFLRVIWTKKAPDQIQPLIDWVNMLTDGSIA